MRIQCGLRVKIHGGEYILARMGPSGSNYLTNFINLKTGNRWSRNVVVKDHRNLTEKEWDELKNDTDLVILNEKPSHSSLEQIVSQQVKQLKGEA